MGLLKQVDIGYIKEDFYGPMPQLKDMPEIQYKICMKCGRDLIFAEEDGGKSRNWETIIIPTWRCPKTLKHSLFGDWTLHDEYAPSHFIDWTWQKRYYK